MSQEKPEQLSSITLIKDKVMEPYFIGKDHYCYTIYENVESSESPGKTYLKQWGHYTNLGSCLKGVAKMKISKVKEFTSLNEYISAWTDLQEKFNQTINNELWAN